MEIVRSEEWRKKDEDRKDLRYDPSSVKPLKDVVCWSDRTDEDISLACRILDREILQRDEK